MVFKNLGAFFLLVLVDMLSIKIVVLKIILLGKTKIVISFSAD